MASLRKASSYSKRKVRPYTRKSGSRKRAYIKAIPPSKIVKFNMGDLKGHNQGKHKFQVGYVSSEKVQLRDNALESCRTLLNKALDKSVPGQYYLEIRVYPHQILRENKTAAGAGADRLSSGMKHSFGSTMGRAAIVNPGKELFIITTVDERTARIARKILNLVKTKVPCRGRIVFEKLD
ncbi:50S ribosomal protein L16 [Candidatus Pacearchaeota archaeon]|nr:50S ribosomal protein L16 [Candidatus Pacearchaeota archaeon]|tara:strand:+ start:234 stop:773 length:540 start_codon:yes stop_codon:yes gene_type:complete